MRLIYFEVSESNDCVIIPVDVVVGTRNDELREVCPDGMAA